MNNHPLSLTFDLGRLMSLLALLILLGVPLASADERREAFDLPREVLALGSEEFVTRSEAEKKIQAWAQENADKSPAALLSQHDATKNPEIRTRLFRIIRKMKTSDLSRGFLGIQMGNQLLPQGAQQPQAPIGVIVTFPVEGGPAAKAGIQAGDIITQIDKVKIDGFNGPQKLSTYVKSKNAGHQIRVFFLRQEEKKETVVTLDPLPSGVAGFTDPASTAKKEEEQEEDFQLWLNKQRSARE